MSPFLHAGPGEPLDVVSDWMEQAALRYVRLGSPDFSGASAFAPYNDYFARGPGLRQAFALFRERVFPDGRVDVDRMLGAGLVRAMDNVLIALNRRGGSHHAENLVELFGLALDTDPTRTLDWFGSVLRSRESVILAGVMVHGKRALFVLLEQAMPDGSPRDGLRSVADAALDFALDRRRRLNDPDFEGDLADTLRLLMPRILLVQKGDDRAGRQLRLIRQLLKGPADGDSAMSVIELAIDFEAERLLSRGDDALATGLVEGEAARWSAAIDPHLGALVAAMDDPEKKRWRVSGQLLVAIFGADLDPVAREGKEGDEPPGGRLSTGQEGSLWQGLNEALAENGAPQILIDVADRSAPFRPAP